MADGIGACVKGTAGTWPRGYSWGILMWSAICGALVASVAFHSLIPRLVIGLVFFGSGVARVWIFRSMRQPVFIARPEGILLGGMRCRVQLPWQEIQEIRISPGAGGALADVLLPPSAPFAPPRFSPTVEVLLGVIVPFSPLFLKPPLLTQLTDPLRYSVPLWGITADELAGRLQSVAPDSVPIVR